MTHSCVCVCLSSYCPVMWRAGLCRLDPVLRIKLATLADLSDCLFTPDSSRLKCATAKEPCKNSTHGAVFHTGVTGSPTCITLSQHEANTEPARGSGPKGPRPAPPAARPTSRGLCAPPPRWDASAPPAGGPGGPGGKANAGNQKEPTSGVPLF